MKKLILITALLISGCSTMPKTVYVPTPIDCPKPKLDPLKSIPKLSKEPSPQEFVKWCVVSNKTLEIELRACRRQLKSE